MRNSGATAVVEGVGDHACEYMTGGRVVILGETGRNLGAGMSGGIAYVLDLDPGRVNPEMVDLDPLGEQDEAELMAILRQHAEETESVPARELLGDWARSAGRFTKVMPKDYKRVMQLQAQAVEQGLDPMVLVMGGGRG